MKKALLILSVIALLSGCAPRQNDPRIAVQSGVGSDTLASNIITRPIGQAVSFVIGEGIVVDDIKEARTPEGFLEVQVGGYNQSMFKKRFDYKVEWMEASGMTIDSVMSKWMPVSVPGKSRFTFKVISPHPRAVDYWINTRVTKHMDN
ncbi:MAG TPA: YcfL family protein [Sedimentisphaerales bacterium]|nr:YcfL family protein [Sedimentisphaerales bacterium]